MNTNIFSRRVLVLEDLTRPREWLVEQVMQADGPATLVDAGPNPGAVTDRAGTADLSLRSR